MGFGRRLESAIANRAQIENLHHKCAHGQHSDKAGDRRALDWEREGWIEEYLSGESIAEIGRRHEISRSTIGRMDAWTLAGVWRARLHIARGMQFWSTDGEFLGLLRTPLLWPVFVCVVFRTFMLLARRFFSLGGLRGVCRWVEAFRKMFRRVRLLPYWIDFWTTLGLVRCF